MKLFLSLLILITGIAQAQMANHPPVPQWLGVAGNQAVRIETRFEQTAPLLKAILLLATDTDAEVALNGKPVRRVPSSKGQPAVSLDMTALITKGTNVL